MSDTDLSEYKDLSSAASYLMIYAALAGTCMLFVFFDEGWPSDVYGMWSVGIPTVLFLALSLTAWRIRKGKRWTWVPAMLFSLIFLLVFPIGTIISYHVLKALWRHRHNFHPFANHAESVSSKLKRPSSGFLACLFILGIPYALGIYAYVGDRYMPSKVVRALPEGAMDIEEYYEGAGITGDTVRLVKARVKRATPQVEIYVA